MIRTYLIQLASRDGGHSRSVRFIGKVTSAEAFAHRMSDNLSRVTVTLRRANDPDHMNILTINRP